MTKKFVHVLLDQNEHDPASGLWIDPQAITSLEILPTTEYTGKQPEEWYVRGMVPGHVFVIPRDMRTPDVMWETADKAYISIRAWVKKYMGDDVEVWA